MPIAIIINFSEETLKYVCKKVYPYLSYKNCVFQPEEISFMPRISNYVNKCMRFEVNLKIASKKYEKPGWVPSIPTTIASSIVTHYLDIYI